MPSSPTLERISSNFNKLRKGYRYLYGNGNENENGNKINPQMISMILLFYPLITLFLLYYLKPSFILRDQSTPLDGRRGSEIDFEKLLKWFIILQLPTLFYFLLPSLSSKVSNTSK